MGGRPGGEDVDRGKDDGPDGDRAYLRFVPLGTQIALTIVLGVFGGLWLDRQAGSSPAFTVVGSLLGIFLGLGAVILEVGKGRR
jgi:F0F1-type ATP synthase assembly protein I